MICQECGAEFSAKRSDAKYCPKGGCRQRVYRRRLALRPEKLAARRGRLMRQKGINIQSLADRWGVHRSVAARIVNGERRSYEKEWDLAERLGCERLDIFEPAVRGERDIIPDDPSKV